MLKREIESLQVQLKDISSDIIGRESELTLHKGKLEAEKRKFITEKDIAISQLELERQSIGVSILQVKNGFKEGRTIYTKYNTCCIGI